MARGRFNKDDMFLVALIGHGLQINEPFFCPTDATPNRTDTLVSLKWMCNEFESSLGSGPRMLLVDACRNPPVGTGIGKDWLTPPQKVGALFSCEVGRRAFDHEKLQHGVFSYFVLKALRGEAEEAKDTKGQVTAASLQDYLADQVPRKAKELMLDEQRPVFVAALPGLSPVLNYKAWWAQEKFAS